MPNPAPRICRLSSDGTKIPRNASGSRCKSVYDLFVARVSEARSLPADQVSGFAEGRIFAAREALALGMVR